MNDETSIRRDRSRGIQTFETYGKFDSWTPDNYTKLEVARHALLKLVDQLTDRDTFTLTKFSNLSDTPLPPTKMDTAGRAKARAAIESLQAGGGTSLYEGVQRALRQAEAQRRTRTGDSIRRLLLLTDGQATDGKDSPQSYMQMHFSVDSSIGFTTFGLGTTYNGELLSWLARNGGSHYYIEQAETIATAFGSEFGAAASIFAKDVKVEIAPVDGHQVEILNDLPVQQVGGLYEIDVGTLLADQSFDIALKIDLPRVARILKTPVRVAGVSAIGGGYSFGIPINVERTSLTNADKTDDADVMRAVVIQKAAKVTKKAEQLGADGQVEAARKMLVEFAEFARARGCEDIAKVQEALAEEGYRTTEAYRSKGQKMSSSVGATYKTQRDSTGGRSYGGVDLSKSFGTGVQRQMAGSFAIVNAAHVDGFEDDMPDLDMMVTR